MRLEKYLVNEKFNLNYPVKVIGAPAGRDAQDFFTEFMVGEEKYRFGAEEYFFEDIFGYPDDDKDFVPDRHAWDVGFANISKHPGKDAKNYLTKEFVDNFDCVIVMHIPRWSTRNWDVLRHQRVMWRTIGQYVASIEQTIHPYVKQGLEIVRYSPREVNIP